MTHKLLESRFKVLFDASAALTVRLLLLLPQSDGQGCLKLLCLDDTALHVSTTASTYIRGHAQEDPRTCSIALSSSIGPLLQEP